MKLGGVGLTSMSRRLSRQVSCAKAWRETARHTTACARARAAAVAMYDTREARPRHELYDLGEQGLANVHVHSSGQSMPGSTRFLARKFKSAPNKISL